MYRMAELIDRGGCRCFTDKGTHNSLLLHSGAHLQWHDGEQDAARGPEPEPSFDAMCCDSEGPARVSDSAAQPAGQPVGTAPEQEVDAECATQRESGGVVAGASSEEQQVHRACCTLSYHLAFFGSLALSQTAFIEHRMEKAQRTAGSMPSRNPKIEHAMAGVFHCADITENQDDLQAELLGVVRAGSNAVVAFCKSKLQLRANTSLPLHACICLMRLANIDKDVASNDIDVAAEALPIMVYLLQHGNRYVIPEARFLR
jgi:hypothetical protein